MERKPLPIGIEDFKEVIDSGYYFVDKTLHDKRFDCKQGKGRTFYQTKKIRQNFEYEHDSALL